MTEEAVADKQSAKPRDRFLGLPSLKGGRLYRWALVLVVWIWLLNLAWLYGADPQDRGTFGDMFGGVNALFSGLAFATLIYTAWMQREELIEQRKELRETREVFKAQSDTLALQRFEGTFFAMLAALDRVVAGLTLPGTEFVGRAVLSVSAGSFRTSLENRSLYYRSFDAQGAQVRDVAQQHVHGWESTLGTYFRSVYHLLKLVDGADVPDKKRYTSLLRAYMSGDEQLLLLVNCALGAGQEFFQPRLIRYAMLENMPLAGLPMAAAVLSQIDVKAFGSDAAKVQSIVFSAATSDVMSGPYTR